MFAVSLIFAIVTSFSQFIDELSAKRAPFDFDISAQIALVSTNGPVCAKIIGEHRTGLWRTLLIPLAGAEDAYVGDRVRIQGRCNAYADKQFDNSPQSSLSISHMTRLGPAPFPPPRPATSWAINSGHYLRSIATLEGTLASVVRDESNPNFIWLIVRTSTGKFRVLTTTSETALDELNGLKDAEIRFTGLCDMTWNWRRFLGYHLMLFGRKGFTILKPPPASPFDGDPLGLNTQSIHREHASGTVIGLGHRDVFIRQDNGMFLPVSLEAGATPPRVGTHVEAAGFVEPDQNNMRLVEAVLRPTGRPAAKPEAARDLLRMDASAYGQVIRLRGILNDPGVPANTAESLTVRCGAQTIPLDVAALRGQLDARLCGECEVEVCGICSVVFEQDPAGAAFPAFKGILVIPRTGDDIRIVRLPPWWTPARFAGAVGILLALLVAILIWNASLRHAVIRKSTALLKEQVAKLEERLKLDERTRLAAELHDYLAQNLTVVSYRLSAALSAFRKKRDDTADYLESADRMLRSCRVDLRRCLWDLKSDTLDEPDFSRAVAKAVTPVSGKAALHIRFNVRRARLSDSTAHAILSICRELVANAVLHGHAETVRIAGGLKDGAINFSVRDDGCGFDPAARPGQADGHFGLDGIVERIKHLDGTLTVDSTLGRGTRVAVTVKNRGTK